MKVNLSMEDMVLIRNNLRAVRVYRETDIPHGTILWYPYMEELLNKINKAIRDLELESGFELMAPP
tara:strand:- start:25 stop:222 length:198 start_codon:yes stop_codon:yes gene_type:complete